MPSHVTLPSPLLLASREIDLIVFPENRGKSAALQTGFKRAIARNFQFAFSIDSDLQHRPEDFSKYLNKQNENQADLVIGRRNFSPKKMPFPRILSNSLTSIIVSIFTGYKIFDSQFGFRLYNLQLIDKMKFHSERYQFETEIIFKFARRKSKIDFVPVPTIYQNEKSYISHNRDIWNFIKIVFYEIFLDR